MRVLQRVVITDRAGLCRGGVGGLGWVGHLDSPCKKHRPCDAITRFRYIEVLHHVFDYYWGKENRSLYRGGSTVNRSLTVTKRDHYLWNSTDVNKTFTFFLKKR